MATVSVGLGKVTFIGTTEKSGLGQKWTEPLAYTGINMANPAETQTANIDGTDTSVIMAYVQQDFINLGNGIAAITDGSFDAMQFRYDATLYKY